MHVLLRMGGLASVLAACAGSAPPAVPPPSPCPSVTAASPTAATAPLDVKVADVDRVEAKVLERLNAKDAAGLFALYGDAMRAAVPLDKTEELVQSGATQWGKLADATSPRRHATYSITTEHGPFQLELTIDEHGAIAGMFLHAKPPAPPPVAHSQMPLALPFKGKWTVAWGGDTSEANIHVRAGAPGVPWSQRRAADLFVKGADGKTFRTDGKKNEDYLAYGLPVLAVADGQVVTVIDGVPENEPGTLNPSYLAGNEVMIRHADNLYSFYAHLQPGKIKGEGRSEGEAR